MYTLYKPYIYKYIIIFFYDKKKKNKNHVVTTIPIVYIIQTLHIYKYIIMFFHIYYLFDVINGLAISNFVSLLISDMEHY